MDLDKPMGTAQFMHLVVLLGLAPGGAYWYRVGSASDGWSRWIRFVMHGVAGKPTSFLALADMGADETVGGQTTAFMARELADGPGPMLPGGDLPQFVREFLACFPRVACFELLMRARDPSGAAIFSP